MEIFFKKASLIRKKAEKLVAIVVPLANNSVLTDEEHISLKHLDHFLGKYDKYFIAPKNLRFNYPNFRFKRFNNEYFGSAAAHNKLLFAPKFYKTFLDYEFVLIYHLDSLVFSDELEEWCKMDFDYIAPPWIKHKDAPYAGIKSFENKVGNGGFSLRKIRSFLKVFYSPVYLEEPSKYWKRVYSSLSISKRFINLPKKYMKYMAKFNGARWEMSKYRTNEDHFWANRATYYYPDFTIASVETALRFAFECVPRYCFELNNYNLPFGCHAWNKYDRKFWERYLLH